MRLYFKLLLAAPVLFLLYFYGLTRAGLIGPDEPRYAAIGREMAHSGDWVTPRLWGERWFEKPALLYWMVAAGNKAGLDADLAPRAPVAILSVAFLFFFFFRLRREFGEKTAWYGTAILATSTGWLAYSHVAVTDLPLAATFNAAILLALPWVRSGGRRGLAIGGAALGLAVLAKGLVPLVLAAPLLWVGRPTWPDLIIFGSVCLAVAVPWYVACWLQNGDVFLDEFLWKHHFARFVSDELQHVQPWWFYLPVIAGLLFPWTPLIAGLKGLDWREPRTQLLLLTLGFGLLFFSASTNKLPGYVLPLIPLLAVLLGVQLAQRRINRWLVAIAALLLGLTPMVAATLPDALAAGLSRTPIQGAWFPLLLAGAGMAWLVCRRGAAQGFIVTATLAALSIVYLKWDMFPRLDETASARPIWRRMAATGAPRCVDEMHRAIRYGLNYYAGQELPACTASRE